VWDRDEFSKDDLIGSARCNLEDIQSGELFVLFSRDDLIGTKRCNLEIDTFVP